MAAAILKGEKTIADMTVETQDDITVYYNSAIAAKNGFTLPDSILQRGVDLTE